MYIFVKALNFFRKVELESNTVNLWGFVCRTVFPFVS